MAKNKVSYNPINSTEIDWTSPDPENNLPWSGKSIQEYIRKNIALAIEAYERRAGDQWFDPATYVQYFFKNREDKEAWLEDRSLTSKVISTCPFTFEAIQFQIKIINMMETDNVYFTTNSEVAELSVRFISQRKSVTDSQWEEIAEDAIFTVSVDKGVTGVYEDIITNKLVLSGDTFTFDVRDFLNTGNNRVKVTCEGVNSKQITSFTYKVNLTSMYLSPSNFRWYIPFIEGEDYSLGGMHIGGAIDKIMYIKITNELGYSKIYENNIGTATYITNDYFFTGLEFPKMGTGVYNVEVWLDAEGLHSEHLIYNIMCIAAADKYKAQLIATSEIAAKATNYGENTLFQYALYNAGASVGTPHINITAVVNTNPIILKNEDIIDVPTSVPIPYNFNLEVETQETELNLDVELTYGIVQKIIYPIDNTASFPPLGNSVFYLNASNRNNGQVNKLKVINEANKTSVEVDWTNMAWIDGIDGWTLDDTGRRCLFMPAGSKAIIDETFFKGANNITIEVAYKVKNVADYSEPVLSICDDPRSDSFRGLKILPDRIMLHSRDLNTTANDYIQSYNCKDEEVVHALTTIVKNYKTNYGNLAQIYVNGGKKVEFEFSNTDSWENNGKLIIGSETSDFYLYYVRVYRNGFGFQDAQQNHLSSLPDSKSKAEVNNKNLEILDDSYNIDFNKVKGRYNCLAIELLNGGKLPGYGMSKDYSVWCNAECFFAEHPEWNWILKNVYLEGQGTTSMNYWLWNLRFRLDKSGNLEIQYADGSISTIKKLKFLGDTHNLVERLTSKKDYASSSHAAKMGGVEAYNDLYHALNLVNELGERVAVYQEPFFFFEKILKEGTNDQYIYKFIGLYALGPDKADPGTFGYDKEIAKDLIDLEGTDHSVRGAGYNYPYDRLKYVEEEGAICVNKGILGYEAAFDVNHCGSKTTEAEKQAYLDAEFEPFYNCIYNNSCLIMGTNKPISEINADIDAWGIQKDKDGHAYQRYEIWIDGEYDIYYLDRETNKYTKNRVNLLTQLGITKDELSGKTIEEKNTIFVNKRIEIYEANIGNYLDRDSFAMETAFKFIFGVKDNFIKNYYPFKVLKFVDGGRYKGRQDDLDSMMPFDNQGLPSAKYSIELFDWTDEKRTAYVFKGEDSVLLQNELKSPTGQLKFMQAGKRILTQMYSDAKSGTSYLERIMNWIDERFFDKAQNYFPISAYNIDAEYSYEEAWPQYKKGTYDVDVNPLSQSRGSAYENMRGWMEKRIIFCLSYFGVGPFEQYNDTSLGRINFRTQQAQNFTLTPAIDLYPAISSGTVPLKSLTRIKEGESVTIEGAGGTNTGVYIMAADYLKDIGDLSKLAVDASSNAAIAVTSKRLQRVKIGDENPDEVTSNLQTLSLGNCPSLLTVDARNLESLTGTVDLTNCPRLREAYFGNTDIRDIQLQNGSKIRKLQTSSKLSQLTLQNLPFLTLDNFELNSKATIEDIRVENCNLNPFGLLRQIYETDGNKLKYIRLVGFDYSGDSKDIDLIQNLALQLDKDGNPTEYKGIDATGVKTEGLPVLEGHIDVAGSVYEDAYATLKEYYPTLGLNITGGFYIRFKDPKVQEIVVANWGDDEGITSAQMANVTSVGTTFKNNTQIEYFDEFEKFGVTSLGEAFTNCSSLKSINLKNVKSLGLYCFNECTSLISLGDISKIETLDKYAIRNAPIEGIIELPNLKEISYGNFNAANITEVLDLGTIISIPGGAAESQHAFTNCNNLEKVVLPNTIEILEASFRNCPKLTIVENLNGNSNIKKLNGVFAGAPLEFEELYLPNIEYYNPVFNKALIKKVNLGDSKITELKGGDNLFVGMQNYTEEVILPDTVTTQTTYSFMGYIKIHTIKMSKNIKKISRLGFQNCSNLSNMELPITVEEIGARAFEGCSKWKAEINLPNLTLLNPYNEGNNHFANSGITKIISLGNIIDIPAQAFYGCKNLTSVNIPNTVQTIGYKAFADCSSLTGDINLPNLHSSTNLAHAFMNTAITSVTIGGTINQIHGDTGGGAFMNCKQLKSATFPNTITVIYSQAFRNCTELEYVGSLEGITTLGSYAFLGCSKLNIDINLPNFTTVYDQAAQCFANSGIKSISMPKLTKVPNGFCENCTNLRGDLTLPGLTYQIVGSAFRGSGLDRITDLGNCTYLGREGDFGCFARCSNLTYAKLPSTVTYIAAGVFRNDSMLQTVIIEAVTPPTLESDSAFFGTANTLTIYVPNSSLEAYKTAANWSYLANKIHPLSELDPNGVNFADPVVEAICITNFDKDNNGYITIDELTSITNVGGVFSNNSNITTFDEFALCTGINTITSYAFDNTSMESITLPPNVKIIDTAALWRNPNLTIKGLDGHGNIEEIRTAAFEGIPMNIHNLSLPKLKKLHARAFKSNNITGTLSFPSLEIISGDTYGINVTRIENLGKVVDMSQSYIFSSCKNLEFVRIPSTVTAVGQEWLAYCPKLVTLIMEPVNPPTTKAYILLNTPIQQNTEGYIYVPDESVDAYKTAEGWSSFADRIRPLSTYVEE